MLENIQSQLVAHCQSLGIDSATWKFVVCSCTAVVSKILTEQEANAIKQWLDSHGLVVHMITSQGEWSVSASSLKYAHVYNMPTVTAR